MGRRTTGGHEGESRPELQIQLGTGGSRDRLPDRRRRPPPSSRGNSGRVNRTKGGEERVRRIDGHEAPRSAVHEGPFVSPLGRRTPKYSTGRGATRWVGASSFDDTTREDARCQCHVLQLPRRRPSKIKIYQKCQSKLVRKYRAQRRNQYVGRSAAPSDPSPPW